MQELVLETPVATPEQPVAAPTEPSPDFSALQADYEARITALTSQATEAEERFLGLKAKLDEVYKKQDEKRKQTLQDQGQWKDLWEEANRTAQEKDTRITELERQIDDLRSSTEAAATRTSAMAAISNAGAINAEQMLQLLQSNLRKNDSGSVVILNGGVEQDITTYLSNLRNPGSGFEHHFKPAGTAGMGAKPNPTATVAPGMTNPWKPGSVNITKQMQISATDPELAAVLKREAGF
jgi:hypothetical protein